MASGAASSNFNRSKHLRRYVPTLLKGLPAFLEQTGHIDQIDQLRHRSKTDQRDQMLSCPFEGICYFCLLSPFLKGSESHVFSFVFCLGRRKRSNKGQHNGGGPPPSRHVTPLCMFFDVPKGPGGGDVMTEITLIGARMGTLALCMQCCF